MLGGIRRHGVCTYSIAYWFVALPWKQRPLKADESSARTSLMHQPLSVINVVNHHLNSDDNIRTENCFVFLLILVVMFFLPCLPFVPQIIFRIKWKGNFPTGRRWFSSFTSSEVRQIKQRERIRQRCDVRSLSWIYRFAVAYLPTWLMMLERVCAHSTSKSVGCHLGRGYVKYLKFTWITRTRGKRFKLDLKFSHHLAEATCDQSINSQIA